MNTTATKSFSLVLLSFALGTVPALVSAHESGLESRLRECASLDQDSQRLSCYDQVLRPANAGERPAPAESQAAPAADKVPEPQPAPATPAADEMPEPQPATEAPAADRVLERQPMPATATAAEVKPAPDDSFGLKEKQPQKPAGTQETPVPDKVPEPPSAPAPTPAAEDESMPEDRFGLKEKQPRDEKARTVTITGIRKDLTNHFVYTTQDGQRWRQIDKRKVHYDEVPFVAEIRTASLGSFYLKPISSGVSVRVRREK